jgi:hypothetical protein
MPFFYLNLTRGNGELPNDPDPQEFPNLEAARLEAIESLREILGHATLDGRSPCCDGIEILDQDGAVLLRVPIEAADEGCLTPKTASNSAKIEHYRAKAAECQRMARKATDPAEKGTWLQMAEDWLCMTRQLRSAKSAAFDAQAKAEGTNQEPSDCEH